LKPHLRITVGTLLRKGRSQREVERLTGVDRKTIRRYEREGPEASSPANSPGVATGSDGRESGVSEGETPPPRLDESVRFRLHRSYKANVGGSIPSAAPKINDLRPSDSVWYPAGARR
jgi:hypothetical protein